MDQGFHAKKTTEEAIDFLVRSYKSSHACQQIQRHVAEICSLVSKAIDTLSRNENIIFSAG
jgi:hypothetical protein